MTPREDLLRLIKALGCWDRALRRDECGDWRINGRYGHICAVPGMTVHGLAPGRGYLIYCRCADEFDEPPPGSKVWTYVKKAMKPFTEVAQDGDTEGTLFMRQLPTPAEAIIIRQHIGIRKRVELGEDVLTAMRERLSRKRGEAAAQTPADDPASTMVPE